GVSVVLADPNVPPSEESDPLADLRSTAYLEPARALLQQTGAWAPLAPYATPLEALRVVDTEGEDVAIRMDRTFVAGDLGEAAFGWNVPNWRARASLTEFLRNAENVTLRFGAGLANILTREREAIVTLSDKSRVRTKLAIGADGRNSALRTQLGIQVKTTRYGQKALAFIVTHDDPHQNISTEVYLSGGAFTLVPLPELEGSHASAVVWMNDGPEAVRLSNLGPENFSEAATKRSASVLGKLTLASERRVWPIVTQEANSLSSERTALVAEAAHVLPPIGAQGLNTSLQDVSALINLAVEQPDSIGSRAYLSAFEKKRRRDIHARAQAIDLYNRVCRSDAPPIAGLRSLGLRLVHDVEPLRKAIMRAGMGA
ncbi:MAG: FAD-dependent monooxygenase, partial [Boseongicola sp.]|nr:FAD-dependent monooxygenase [Boseongicola sp.]